MEQRFGVWVLDELPRVLASCLIRELNAAGRLGDADFGERFEGRHMTAACEHMHELFAPHKQLSNHGYVVLRQLGRGGMAVVYQAKDRALGRQVALKMFDGDHLPTSRDVRRLRAEAEAMARLAHPNIIQIYEIGESDGLPYLALELAELGTLGFG